MGCFASTPKDTGGNRRKPTSIGEVSVYVPGLRVPRPVEFSQAVGDQLPKTLVERLTALRTRIVVMANQEGPTITRTRRKTQHGGSTLSDLHQALVDYLPVLLELTKDGSHLQFKVHFIWVNQEDEEEETAMSNIWYEVLSVLHLMAMLQMSQANLLLLPRGFSDGHNHPKVSEENRRASIDIFLKAAGYLECAVKNVLPQFSAEQRRSLPVDLWPTLNDEILNKQPKGKYPSRTLQPPIEKLPPPELKADGRLRFPWAARLSPQSRNLYRAATPTYRLDGTPEVSIPSKVLKLGPENKDEYIIGKFHKCALPPGGLVHAVVNRIWGRSCKISCKKLGDSSFMFHIPHQPTRQWVIQRGVWHIDDCLLFVLPWTPEGSFKIPEISTLPVWANLKNIPDCCYSRLGISHVASGLGEPILTHKPRLDPTSMGEAKVLVEMELDRDFPKLIALDDKQGNIFLVNVEYTWIPSMCERCGNLGHKAKRCLLPSSTAQVSISASTSQDTSSDVPIVDIDTVMQQKDNVEYSVPTIQKNDLHVSGKTSLQTKDDGAHEPEKHTIEIEGLLSELEATPTLQQENPTASPNFIPTLPTLVDSQPTPTAASIMESSPSTVTNTEVSETLVVGPQATTHTPFAFESPAQFKGSRDVGVDEDGTEPSSSLSLTRGGRETKPPSKYQDMEWKTVRGRGKRGRRGRGSYH